jgi:geranylgeranyl diphosphate synthase type II
MNSDVSEKLQAYIKSLHYGDEPVELYEPIRYLMRLGGKRMRPLLCVMAYQLYRKDTEKVFPAAAAVEVFHNFTLMHDDIMDNAPLRRGHATVHKKWNANVAILSGDVMLVRAYDLLLATDYPHMAELIGAFNRTAAEVCEGQQTDMNFESSTHVTVDAYLHMIRQKTAVLLGYSLWSGARIAQAPAADCDLLYALGVDMGIGFQLTDDLLDVFADQSKFGKQVGGDIIANKKTYLLLRALQDAGAQERRQLEHWLTTTQFQNQEKIEAVTDLYKSLHIEEKTRNLIDFYFNQALGLLDRLSIEKSEYHALKNFMEKLIGRDH